MIKLDLNRSQASDLVYQVIKEMNFQDAKAIILTKYKRNNFNQMTKDEMIDFVQSTAPLLLEKYFQNDE